MAIYLSIAPVQPFADMSTEDVEGEPGVMVVTGDGKVVGVHLADNRLVLRLPQLIERFGLDEDRVWAKLRGDDDVTLGRRSLHGSRNPR
ncbi:MAG: hypothetical protein IT200_01085 [Thermoleophilia bacterium]|nr:hypothetical protein [Thermoleophilia bacterium]